jgi:hypothetical protein
MHSFLRKESVFGYVPVEQDLNSEGTVACKNCIDQKTLKTREILLCLITVLSLTVAATMAFSSRESSNLGTFQGGFTTDFGRFQAFISSILL